MRSTCLNTVLAATLLAAFAAHAQTGPYPNRRITVFAAGPGGTVDIVARIVGQGLSADFNQPVIIENRPAGVLPNQAVAKAAPDGYTLLYTAGSLWVTPLLTTVPYDPVKDFTPVVMVHDVAQILVAHNSLPVNSIADLIALAKAKPGQINWAASNIGSASTLAGELLAYMADINIVRVPYKSAGPRVAALMAGEVHLDFTAGGALAGQLKSGKLHPLGVSTPTPWRLAPDIPPIARTLPGYESRQAGGFLGPAKLPPAITTRLNQEVLKQLKKPEVADKLTGAGIDIIGSTPEEFSRYIDNEMARMGKMIKARGLKED